VPSSIWLTKRGRVGLDEEPPRLLIVFLKEMNPTEIEVGVTQPRVELKCML